jgi:hypothetical protein
MAEFNPRSRALASNGAVTSLVCALTLGCSDDAAVRQPTAKICNSIVHGTDQPTLVHLLPAQRRAIVALTIPLNEETQETGVCSGVIVAPGIVVTAAHCADRDADMKIDDGLTVSCDEAAAAGVIGAADDGSVHPTLDIAILKAKWLMAVDVTPLPLDFTMFTEKWLDKPVELAGYGSSSAETTGTLQFVVEVVERIEAEHFAVTGFGFSGACVGDSGGPALARSNDGRLTVIGILDNGAPSCVGSDNYTRVDQLSDWQPLANALGAGSPGNNIQCEGLSSIGECVRGSAMWCEAGSVHVKSCEGPTPKCGWSAEGGFRCIAPADSPCGEIGSFDECQEDELVSCVDGSLLSRDCRACGQRCRPWADGSGAGCRDE